MKNILTFLLITMPLYAVDICPSMNIGVGPTYNGAKGFHFESSAGAWIGEGSLFIHPVVGYQLSRQEQVNDHAAFIGASLFGGDYILLGAGAQYLIGGLGSSEIQHGFKVGVQSYAILSFGIDISYQYLKSNQFQLTFLFDLATIGYMLRSVM